MEKITPQSQDFAQWYQDIVKEADLAENSEVRGCGIVKPYGYKMWDLIRNELNSRIEKDGVENLYFPIFLPLSNLEMEKDHIEGFAPELAVVTHGGGEELVNKLAVRPTSEAAMYSTYAKWIQSYKDLPMRYNQWANVVRWEKRPRPFLRWSEFQWQEGHTCFANKDEAVTEVAHMLEMYKDIFDWMAIPAILGMKSEAEKFAGADTTYTVEVMAKDGKAIQGATSHYLGTHFAEVFGVKYQGQDGKEHLVHQNSWGMSWRTIGALIMVHGDDKGLRLPPNVAPFQIVIVPITRDENKDKVLNYAKKLKEQLGDYRVKIDDSAGSPGFKFNQWEMKGVPVRIEIGEREVDEDKLTVFRRDLGEKSVMTEAEFLSGVSDLMKSIHENLYSQAEKFMNSHIVRIESWEEIGDQVGFFEASWCESPESEKILKEKYSMVSRCLPKKYEGASPKSKKCFITGEEAKHDWYFAKSY